MKKARAGKTTGLELESKAKIVNILHMGKLHHKNTILRMQRVREIVNLHYEAGNLAKCYKQVWRRYVYPKYPMCYRTFLSYLDLSDDELQTLLDEESPPQRYDGPTLFDFNQD